MSCYRGSHDKDYSPEGEGWSDWRRWCNGRRVNNHSNQEDTVEIFPTPVWSLWPLGWMSLIMSSFETSLTLILKCFWAWLHATLLESCCFVIYVFLFFVFNYRSNSLNAIATSFALLILWSCWRNEGLSCSRLACVMISRRREGSSAGEHYLKGGEGRNLDLMDN